METISCIFCKTKENDARIVIEENGFTGIKCSQCGLIYISPRPTLAEIQNLYGHDQAHYSAEPQMRVSLFKRMHNRHNLKILRHYKKRGSLLEIGAGGGNYLQEARKAGFDVYGIELNPFLADFINRKLSIPCEAAALAESDDDNTYDVIYHSDVLSHFYNPITEFHEMNKRLANHGLIMFETGNLGDVKEKYYSVFTSFQYPDHLFFFSEKNIKDLLDITGFELVAIYRYSILYFLRVFKLLVVLRGKISNLFGHKNSDTSDGTNTLEVSDYSAASVNRNIGLIGIAKNMLSPFLYFLRYKIGYILPKKGKPQTVIVVAKKAEKTA